MLGAYLSGTGNTKYCMELLCSKLNAKLIPIESKDIIERIKENDTIILGYPTQFSNCPYMIREFIKANKQIFKNKNVIVLATMGMFSGDAAGCAARLLKKCGANILGGIHIKMPDSVCDSKLLKKTIEENIVIVKEANLKINKYAEMIMNNKYPHDGIRFYDHIAGLFGQRLWFYGKTNKYYTNVKIDLNKCIRCQRCVSNCPTNNLILDDKCISQLNKCTMCYRCVSHCPSKAITIIGDEVIEQTTIEKFI